MRWKGAALLSAFVLGGCAASTPRPVTVPPAPHSIVAEATPAEAEAEAEKSAKEEPKDEHATRQMNRAIGWTLLGAGADGAVVAIITSFMMLHQDSVRRAGCADKVCTVGGLAANETLHSLGGWNAGAWVLAAAGFGSGLFFLLTNPSDKALKAEVGAATTGSGSGLVVRGAF